MEWAGKHCLLMHIVRKGDIKKTLCTQGKALFLVFLLSLLVIFVHWILPFNAIMYCDYSNYLPPVWQELWYTILWLYLLTYWLPVMPLACGAATKNRHSFLSLAIFSIIPPDLVALHHFRLEFPAPCNSRSSSFYYPFWCPLLWQMQM